MIETAVVSLQVLAALRHGCLATVRLSNDGWEEGDDHAARAALAVLPVWLNDQLDAWEEKNLWGTA